MNLKSATNIVLTDNQCHIKYPDTQICPKCNSSIENLPQTYSKCIKSATQIMNEPQNYVIS